MNRETGAGIAIVCGLLVMSVGVALWLTSGPSAAPPASVSGDADDGPAAKSDPSNRVTHQPIIVRPRPRPDDILRDWQSPAQGHRSDGGRRRSDNTADDLDEPLVPSPSFLPNPDRMR